MTPTERAIRSLGTQAMFELAESAARASQLARDEQRAAEQVSASLAICETMTLELRKQWSSQRISPPLLDALRIAQYHGRASMRLLQKEWAQRKHDEAQAQARLRACRLRQQGLAGVAEKAMHQEALARQRQQDAQQAELWLHTFWED